MEDIYKYYKLSETPIRVRKPHQEFLIMPCYSNDRIIKKSLKDRLIKALKRTLFVSGVLLTFLIVLIGGSIAIGIYFPDIMPIWWLFAGAMGWVCGELLFD
jgi:hypothetical protein